VAIPENLCNLALAKLVQKDRVNTLSAPALPLERHFALIYPHYRDAELSAHPWLFAQARWKLAQLAETLEEAEQACNCTCFCPGMIYVYEKPVDMLKPRRDDCSDWIVLGDRLVSSIPGFLWVEGTKRQTEAAFDPLFSDVLVWRLARETADWPGVTEGKRVEMAQGYRDAITQAQRENAFMRPPRSVEGCDDMFSWLSARAV
jgi:hypothetical protein